MKRLISQFILAITLLLSGCSLLVTETLPAPTLTPPAPTSTVKFILPTEIPLPTMALPTLQPTATIIPTQRAVMPISATVVFDYFSLREGPGRLFDRVAMYESDSQVLVLARALGSEWVLVQTEDFRSGWMNTAGLKTLGDFSPLPLYQHPGAVMLSGHVWNIDQSPAPRIGVRVQPLDNTDPNLMEDVTTSLDGTWYAYLPAGASGSWEVQAVSYGCPPEVPEGQCSIVGNLPDRMTITLPDALNVNLEMSLRP